MSIFTCAFPSTSPATTLQRSAAMVLALVIAVVLSPLYISGNRSNNSRFHRYYYYPEMRLGSGFVAPMVVAGLVMAIKKASSSQAKNNSRVDPPDMARIGGSPWGLAGILAMLMLALSWQNSLQGYLRQ